MDTLFYDPVRKLLLCMACRHGINPEKGLIERHMRENHKDVNIEIRRSLALLDCEGAILPSDKEGARAAQAFGHIPGVETSDGWKCLSCEVAGKEMSTWMVHKSKHGLGETTQFQRCYVQTIFLGGNTNYFAVTPPSKATQAMATEDTLTMHVHKFQHTLRARALIAPSNISHIPLTKWDEKTRWADMHAGEVVAASAAYSVVHHPDDNDAVVYLVKMVSRYLSTIHERIKQLSEYQQRVFKSTTDTLSPRPFKCVEASTFRNYQVAWQKLVGFLLRTQGMEMGSMVVAEPIQVLLRRLVGGGFELREGEGDKEVFKLLHQLSFGLVTEDATRGIWDSSLLSWLSIEGYHRKEQRWQKAWEFRPTMSQVVFCMRLIVVKEWQEDEVEGLTIASARCYAKKYLHDGADAPMTTIHSMRAYAKVAGEDYYGNPTTTWTRGEEGLILKGKTFTLSALREMVKGLIERATDGIETGLLFQGSHWIASIKLDALEDDPMWGAAGQCFVDQNGGQGNDWEVASKRAEGDSWGKALIEELRSAVDGKHVYGLRKKWIDRYEATLELLMVIMHLSGGLVARGTELLNLQWANGWNSHRSVMLFDGDVTLVSTYNKVDALKGAPTVIARILPEKVGQLVVAWIRDVLPFHEAIQSTMSAGQYTDRSPLMFQTNGVAWKTDRLTKVLGRETERALGVRITTRNMRHVMIAIDKRILRQKATTEVDAHILQSGHSEGVEDHHYALDEVSLHGLSAETLACFRQVSSCWHRFWSDELQDRPIVSSTINSVAPAGNLVIQVQELQQSVKTLERIMKALLPTGKEEGQIISPNGNKAFQNITEEEVCRIMERMLGTRAFRSDYQKEAVMHMVTSSKDCLFVAPTGLGKTLAYLIPAQLDRGKVTVVFVPYKSLQEDIINACERMGVTAAELSKHTFVQAEVVVGVPDVSVADDFVGWVKSMVDRKRIRRIVFDECHHLVMDTTWRESWQNLISLCRESDVSGIQKLFLTATLPGDMKMDLYRVMGIRRGEVVEICAPTIQSTVRHEVTKVGSVQGYIEEVRRLIRRRRLPSQADVDSTDDWAGTLVYVKTVVVGSAVSAGLGCDFYHGHVGKEVKKEMVRRFTAGEVDVLVATTALGEGVNIGARRVVVVGGSYSLVDYLQQSGRAGRDGSWSTTTLVMGPGDAEKLEETQAGTVMLAYVEALECRRRFLSAFADGRLVLGCEEGENKCDRCSVSSSRARNRGKESWSGNASRLSGRTKESTISLDYTTATSRTNGITMRYPEELAEKNGSMGWLAQGELMDCPEVWKCSSVEAQDLQFTEGVVQDNNSADLEGIDWTPYDLTCFPALTSIQALSLPRGNLTHVSDSLLESLDGDLSSVMMSDWTHVSDSCVGSSLSEGLIHIQNKTSDDLPGTKISRDVASSAALGLKWQGITEVTGSKRRWGDNLSGAGFHSAKRLMLDSGEQSVDVFGISVPRRFALQQNTRDLREFLQTVDSAKLISIAAENMRGYSKNSDKCLACWLAGRLGGGKHGWGECPHTKVTVKDVSTLKRGVVTASLGKGFHYYCYFHCKAPDHGAKPDFKKACVWEDVVKDVIAVGAFEEVLFPVYDEYASESRQRIDLRSLAVEGVKGVGGVFPNQLLALWAHVVVHVCVRDWQMNS